MTKLLINQAAEAVKQGGGVMKILSLGAGVQSTTILYMSMYGELEKPDYIIFADTGWEPKAVYKHLKQLKLETRIPIHVVSAGNIREDSCRAATRKENHDKIDGGRWASMPFFTVGERIGRLRRQCSREYKTEPIRRKIRELLAGVKLFPGIVEQWIGFSSDEIQRMRLSDVQYIVNYYPLIELSMTRYDCLEWLKSHNITAVRSACLGCPYHANTEWKNIKNNSPDEWKDVIEFDKMIRRRGGVRGDLFLHRSCKPLDEVDFSTPEDHGQSNWLNDCGGECWT